MTRYTGQFTSLKCYAHAEILLTHKDVLLKLEQLERKTIDHDDDIKSSLLPERVIEPKTTVTHDGFNIQRKISSSDSIETVHPAPAHADTSIFFIPQLFCKKFVT